ncbi:hypothetical protein [Isoptericola dokdonensis]|uniref:YtxH domain-containing protein n=1 Tax=Isoptericola dokdonensis DS-3 TaxID=1300344 RepID=A0A161HZB5_9MICO|nr:hypothetical protein [Isoptericola dokdonensis]ANC31923.1 hypothetical protein I598_2383 [Isoptericola dokdonensis DS-3]
MIRRRTLGRALFFGLGYVAGTRAGRERYAQIEAGFRSVVSALRDRSAGSDGTASTQGSGRGTADPYADITLGRS